MIVLTFNPSLENKIKRLYYPPDRLHPVLLFSWKNKYGSTISYTGWWFQPLWKILVSWDDYSQYGKNKNVPNHQPVLYMYISYPNDTTILKCSGWLNPPSLPNPHLCYSWIPVCDGQIHYFSLVKSPFLIHEITIFRHEIIIFMGDIPIFWVRNHR